MKIEELLPKIPNLETRHLVSGDEFSVDELEQLIQLSEYLKKYRRETTRLKLLEGLTLAMLFDKPSLRTRMSFFVAMSELGGFVSESVSANKKAEEPKDTVRVLDGYSHIAMIRTDADKKIEEMVAFSKMPIINGLTDLYHPCQTLADLLTVKESLGKLEGAKVAFVGDGNNILHSLMLMAPRLGVELTYACPEGFNPSSMILRNARVLLEKSSSQTGKVTGYRDPKEAVRGADIVYTDVWTSMGFEKEKSDRERAFRGFQVNEALLKHAKPDSKVMHCMPMERGKEISEDLPDSTRSIIFDQSENRLHAQKAIILSLLRSEVDRNGVER